MTMHCDKVIAVSGAASGIGLATAKLLWERGARVSIADINADALQAALATITDGKDGSDRLFLSVMDVSSSKQVDNWIDRTVSHFGTLDGAVNVAGVVGKNRGIHTIAELSNEEWRFVIGINLDGMFFALRAQTRALQQLGKGGSIVNVSSIAGFQGDEKNAAYSASKHAVIGLTRSAAKEFGHAGIRINAIAPGGVKTPMTQDVPEDMKPKVEAMINTQQPLHRFAEPEELAKSVSYLLGDDSSYVTGSVHVVDGGYAC